MNSSSPLALLLGHVLFVSACDNELLLGRDLPGELDGPADDDAGGSSGGPSAPQCEEIRFLGSVAQVDGALDEGMTLEKVVPVGWISVDGLALPKEHSLRYAVGWRPDGLYFYAEVTDPDLNPPSESTQSWLGDSVALFVDHDGLFNTPPPDYADEGTRQITISSPPNHTDPGTASEVRVYTAGLDRVDPARWISLPRPNGYVVEAFLIAEDLNLAAWQLQSGNDVGFDVGVNVSLPPGSTGNDGDRAGSYFLKIKDPAEGGLDDLPIRNESAFCRAQLL